MSGAALPSGFEVMMQFGLMDAIMGRRSRRFFRGAEIPDGVFAYKSRHEPLPLSEQEKLLVLAAALMLLAGTVNAAEIIRDGDPGFFVGFGGGVVEVIKGETWCTDVAPANFGFVSTLCTLDDTFCFHYY